MDVLWTFNLDLLETGEIFWKTPIQEKIALNFQKNTDYRVFFSKEDSLYKAFQYMQ